MSLSRSSCLLSEALAASPGLWPLSSVATGSHHRQLEQREAAQAEEGQIQPHFSPNSISVIKIKAQRGRDAI